MRTIDAGLLKYNSWPIVDEELLTEFTKLRFRKYKQAICSKIDGIKVTDCCLKYGVSEAQLRPRQIHRCCRIHEDGRPWGFRALIFKKHIQKSSLISILKSKNDKGRRDSFNLLVEQY